MTLKRHRQSDALSRAQARYQRAVATSRATVSLGPVSRFLARGSSARLSPPHAFMIPGSSDVGQSGLVARPDTQYRIGRRASREFAADGNSMSRAAGGQSHRRHKPAIEALPGAPVGGLATSSRAGKSVQSSATVSRGSVVPTPRSRLAGTGLPTHQAGNKPSFPDRVPAALERVWNVSKKRFVNAWDPDDPVGLNVETRIEQRRPGGYFHGPIGFANEAISGPLIAVGDTILRAGNGLLHGGAFGVNQIASELGLVGQNDRRLARDILGMVQMSLGRAGSAPTFAGKTGRVRHASPKIRRRISAEPRLSATRRQHDGALRSGRLGSGRATRISTQPEPPAGAYETIFPRGPGASVGGLPNGYTYVSRWASPEEALLWLQNQSTAIPNGIGRQAGRVHVTLPGAPRPGGVKSVRIDFAIPRAALMKTGDDQWRQIFQPVQSTPIHNVQIHIPKDGKTLGRSKL